MTSRRCEIGVDCLGRIDGHHDDYDKPDKLRWLCRRHHMLWHSEHGHAKGWPPAKHSRTPDVRQVSTWVPSELKTQVEELASADRRSVSQWLRLLIERRVEKAKAPA